MDAYRDSENRLHGMMKEKRTVTERRNAQKKEAMDRLAKLKTLSLQTGTLFFFFNLVSIITYRYTLHLMAIRFQHIIRPLIDIFIYSSL